MKNTSEHTRERAMRAAHKAFSRLVCTGSPHIYTDTCFRLGFILRHTSELRKNHLRVKITNSVLRELLIKRQLHWADRKQQEIRKRGDLFELLPRSAAERKSRVYADADFEQRFRDDVESPKVFLTADRELAQKIAALPSPPTIFLEYTPKHSCPHSTGVILWNDYMKLKSDECQMSVR